MDLILELILIILMIILAPVIIAMLIAFLFGATGIGYFSIVTSISVFIWLLIILYLHI